MSRVKGVPMYVGWSKSHLMNVEAVISGLSSTASAMSHELREASPFHICSYQAHFKATGFARTEMYSVLSWVENWKWKRLLYLKLLDEPWLRLLRVIW